MGRTNYYYTLYRIIRILRYKKLRVKNNYTRLVTRYHDYSIYEYNIILRPSESNIEINMSEVNIYYIGIYRYLMYGLAPICVRPRNAYIICTHRKAL